MATASKQLEQIAAAANAAQVARDVAKQASDVAQKVAETAASVAQNVLVFATDIKYIKDDIKEIKEALSTKYVTKEEFSPIKSVVYGLVAIILVTVVGALVAVVVTK